MLPFQFNGSTVNLGGLLVLCTSHLAGEGVNLKTISFKMNLFDIDGRVFSVL